MSSLFLLICVVLLVWYWQSGLRCHDIAIATARMTCKQQGLQLLDGTVSLKDMRPFYRGIDDFGMERTYVFDYSEDGISRLSGCVVLVKNRVESVVLEDHPDEHQ